MARALGHAKSDSCASPPASNCRDRPPRVENLLQPHSVVKTKKQGTSKDRHCRKTQPMTTCQPDHLESKFGSDYHQSVGTVREDGSLDVGLEIARRRNVARGRRESPKTMSGALYSGTRLEPWHPEDGPELEFTVSSFFSALFLCFFIYFVCVSCCVH